MGDHHHHKDLAKVRCAVLTVSDTRTAEDDRSGLLIRECLEAAGHSVSSHEILPDEASLVATEVVALADSAAVDVVLLTGGTGLAVRDTTYEALEDLYEKRIDGFGELFRALSYEEIGAAAMLSRASAGVVRGAAVFSMPGSVAACRLAMDKLIVPQLGHVAGLLGQEGNR